MWTPCSHVRVFQDCKCSDWNFNPSQTRVGKDSLHKSSAARVDSLQTSALVTQQARESAVSLSSKDITHSQKHTEMRTCDTVSNIKAAQSRLYPSGSAFHNAPCCFPYSIIRLKSILIPAAVERPLSNTRTCILFTVTHTLRLGGVTSFCLYCQQSGDTLSLQKCSCLVSACFTTHRNKEWVIPCSEI